MNVPRIPPAFDPRAERASFAVSERDLSGWIRVGNRTIDLGALRSADEPGLRLTRKSASVLVVLARHRGRTVTRTDLLDGVWEGTCPTPEVVTQAIVELRRVLDDGTSATVIETIPKLGYRLVGECASGTARLRAAPDVDGPVAAAGVVVAATILPESIAVASPTAAVRRAPRWRAVVLAAAIALLAGLALARLIGGAADPAQLSGAKLLSEPRYITGSAGAEIYPQLSPDGSSIAYSAREDGAYKLFLQGTNGALPARLRGSSAGDELMPAWAPDGRTLAYVSIDGERIEVRLFALPGGPDRVAFASTPQFVPFLHWSPDGSRLLSSRLTEGGGFTLSEFDVAAGTHTPLRYARLPGDIDLEPRYSADGAKIAFQHSSGTATTLMLLDRSLGTVRPVLARATALRGFDWLDANSLLAATPSATGWQLVEIALDGTLRETGVRDAMYPSVSGTDVAFARALTRSTVQVRSLTDVAEAPQLVAPGSGRDEGPVYAPDGLRIAFASDRSGRNQVWVQQPGAREPLPIGPALESTARSLSWSMDSQQLAFVATDAGAPAIFVADLPSGRAWTVPTPGLAPGSVAFAVASDALWFTAGSPAHLYRLGGTHGTQPILATRIAARGVQTHAGLEGLVVADRCLDWLRDDLTRVHRYCPDRWGAWRAGKAAIWSTVSAGMWAESPRRHDLLSGTDRTYPLELTAAGGFDIAPDESRILHAATTADDTDVGFARVLGVVR